MGTCSTCGGPLGFGRELKQQCAGCEGAADFYGAILAAALLAAFAALVALLKAVGWWVSNLASSVGRDLERGRLTWATVGWASPAFAVGAVLVMGLLAPPRPAGVASQPVPLGATTAPTTVSAGFDIAYEVTVGGVVVDILRQSVNTCGGYAFGLGIWNKSPKDVTVHYSFQSEVSTGGWNEPSSGCYFTSLTEGSQVVAAGTLGDFGFRDLSPGATVISVTVDAHPPVQWTLPH
jgi:hypothetical protein